MRSAKYLLLAALTIVSGAPGAIAQTKLKWAHVYETGEPYHTQALWAAEEIKKRSNGRYQIDVFPASQLGNENQINEGLGLGTVDMIYTGVAFAGSIHKPVANTMLLMCCAISSTGSFIATPHSSAKSPRATRTRPSTR